MVLKLDFKCNHYQSLFKIILSSWLKTSKQVTCIIACNKQVNASSVLELNLTNVKDADRVQGSRYMKKCKLTPCSEKLNFQTDGTVLIATPTMCEATLSQGELIKQLTPRPSESITTSWFSLFLHFLKLLSLATPFSYLLSRYSNTVSKFTPQF